MSERGILEALVLVMSHITMVTVVIICVVVIQPQGKLVVSGSPMYLKSHYGTGYQLTMAKEQEHGAYAEALPAEDSANKDGKRNGLL